MGIMSTRGIFLTVLLALLLIPAAARATPDWVPSIAFPVPGNAFGGMDEVRYQDGGIATEAFLEVQSLSPVQTTLHVGMLSPGGSYVDQLVIPSSAEAIPTGAQIAVAPDGAAVAVWAELIGSNLETSPYRYRAAYRPAGSGSWEAPVTIAVDTERDKEIYEYFTLTIGSDGTAAVGVQHIASGEKGAARGEPVYRLDVAVHPPSGGWQAPVRISPTSESAEGLDLGLDGQGDVTAAYTLRFNEGSTNSTSDDRATVIVRRRPASNGVWGFAEDVTKSEIQWTADALHLGENEAGDAVVTYQYMRSSPQELDAWAV